MKDIKTLIESGASAKDILSEATYVVYAAPDRTSTLKKNHVIKTFSASNDAAAKKKVSGWLETEESAEENLPKWAEGDNLWLKSPKGDLWLDFMEEWEDSDVIVK